MPKKASNRLASPTAKAMGRLKVELKHHGMTVIVEIDNLWFRKLYLLELELHISIKYFAFYIF